MATPSRPAAPPVGDHPRHDHQGPPTSITPPNSADGKKNAPDSVPSELSDLDLEHNGGAEGVATVSSTCEEQQQQHDEAEEEEEVVPDHYYGGGNIPVFKPTMSQFRDFAAFVKKVDKYGMKSGVVKIIPPQEWRESLHALDEAVKTIRVKNPIVQEFHGSHGTYTQANIEKQRSYNLPQWKALCEEGSHQPPARRGERRRDRPARASTRNKSVKPEGPPTPVSPESNPVEVKPEELSDGESLPAPKKRGRQAKSVSSRRKHNRGDAADFVDEEAFDGFDYRIHDNQEYTAERCEELETAYWKSLMYNNPIYGADMPGSLFEESVDSWNVAKLPNLLDVLGQKVPGVNTAYLYLGMWKATFAWHLEDVDLYSINYIHFGAPKQWYSISQEDISKFEAAMKSMWPTDAKNCDQFLRHKTYLVSPSILKSQYGVTVNRMVHYEGEFVITFPYGYHSGYNLGYNCAESVNFATEKWLDYGRIAKKCHCESDSVWIDVDEIERKLRGEVTPEYYEEIGHPGGASDRLTPPRSVPEKATRVKKRKRDGEEPKTKRVKLVVEAPRKIPCLLCPNDYDFEELLPTEDGKSHVHRRCAMYIEETSILKNDDEIEVVCDVDRIPKARMGLKCLYCREVRGACFQCNFGKCTRSYHPTCAIVAGVQVEFGQVIVIAGDGNEYTTSGVDLRCKYHRPKRASNLPGAGLDRDRGTNGLAPKVELGNYGNLTEEAFDRYRDGAEMAQKLVPKKFNNVAGYVVNGDPDMNLMAPKLEPNNLVQFEFEFSKDPYGGVVLENRVSERMLRLQVLPKGDIIELNYRHLIPVKKSNFASLPAGIHPLPDHLARKPGTQNDLALSLPVLGTPFNDPRSDHTWSEFECAELPVNLVTNKFDLFEPEKLWIYLGKTSTDSKAQYTDNPQVPVHNPRSQFLNYLKTIRAPALHTFQPHHRLHSSAQTSLGKPASSAAMRLPDFPAEASSSKRNYFTTPPFDSVNISRNPLPIDESYWQPAQPQQRQELQQPPQPQQPAQPHQPQQPPQQPPQPQRTQQSQQHQQPQQPHHAHHAPSPPVAPWVPQPRPEGRILPPLQGPPTVCALQHHQLRTRCKLLEITRRINNFACYEIAAPSWVADTLLGPIDAPVCANYMEKLIGEMGRSIIQTPAWDDEGNLMPRVPLDMNSRPVQQLVSTIKVVIENHLTDIGRLEERRRARVEAGEEIPQASMFVPRFAGRWRYLDIERGSAPTVYQSPYAPGPDFGFSEFAKERYGMPDMAPTANDESLANDFFGQLSLDNQDRVTQEVGSFVPPPPLGEEGNTSMQSYENNGPSGFQTSNTSIMGFSVGPQPLDPALHVDSPTSYPRATAHQDSPQHFPHNDENESILPRHVQDQDLFGDQQANQRFWQGGGPWVGGPHAHNEDGVSVMFGPHPRHDYASSDMDVGRGPSSLHSMDMAGFEPDNNDGNYPELSP